MKKGTNLLMACCMACGIASGYAQVKPTVEIQAETRMGYNYESVDGDKLDGASGIKGNFLNVRLDGQLSPRFSYSWRQRLNKKISDSNYFDATDWIYLSYRADKHWSFSAGKQVVMIGGYEYDRAPIDIFMASEYWGNIACYQFGGSATYTTAKGRDKLSFQFCESPFHSDLHSDLFAYNLFWAGDHGPLSTLYSFNLLEYAPKRYITYLALGNRLSLGGFRLELDLMNRAAAHQPYLFRDCSVVAELSCFCLPKLEVYAKASYDVNRTDVAADCCVLPGTELTSFGGGVNFYPLKREKSNVRLHAGAAYTTGRNGNPEGFLSDKQLYVNVGLTWKLHLLSLGK